MAMSQSLEPENMVPHMAKGTLQMQVKDLEIGRLSQFIQEGSV